MVDTSEWKEIKLTAMKAVIEQNNADKKFTFLWDQQGNVPTFFNYGGKFFDFTAATIKMAMGNMTEDQCIDELRRNTVFAWRGGWMQGISCGKGPIKFNQWLNHKAFPTHTFFNYEEAHKEANYQKIPQGDEELADLTGQVHKRELFFMDEKYSMTIITQGDEATVAEILKNLPHAAQFAKVIVK